MVYCVVNVNKISGMERSVLMAEKQFNKGDVVFQQGDAADCFYTVIEGSVGIFANYDGGSEYLLSEITKGQYFGEMAVIDASPRSAGAVALEDGTRLNQISTEELNRMAQSKRMVTPCVDMSLDGVYSAFGKLDAKRIINQSDLGLAETPDAQVRKAGWQVSNGNMTVSEAVEAFGTLE